jgi:circadian clock protein KaiC
MSPLPRSGIPEAGAEAAGKKPFSARGPRKKPTFIPGFDEITEGGLPEGRMTAVVGGPGAGKSLFALQNLLNRASRAGEPGLFVTFEETIDRVQSHIAGLDWDFGPIERGEVVLIDARVPVDAVHAGAFDFAGLLAILAARKVETGAVNIVFDGIDLLMGTLNDDFLERQELARLDDWARTAGVSGVVTVKSYGASERDQRRVDLIQYISDSVVMLDAALHSTYFARTIRVVKYRGSGYVPNAIPMIIGCSGIEVVPAQISRESYPVYSERVSSGVARLDAILDGGYIRGSCILVSGAPGTAKTSIAASLTASACASGRQALFVSFDESDAQIVANMKSIGIDLEPHVASGRLVMAAMRSKGHSPEECFLRIAGLISRDAPSVLVVDPLSALGGTPYPFASAIAEALIDLAKSKGITFLSTSLLGDVAGETETSISHISTIADTWMHLSYVLQNGERNRALTIIKSRGTGHSNQVRELLLGGAGVDLADVYVGEGGVLLGTARAEKLEEEAREERLLAIRHSQREFELQRNVAALEARARTIDLELQSKLKETELENQAETVRIQSRISAAERRLRMRRKTDDAPDSFPGADRPAGKGH